MKYKINFKPAKKTQKNFEPNSYNVDTSKVTVKKQESWTLITDTLLEKINKINLSDEIPEREKFTAIDFIFLNYIILKTDYDNIFTLPLQKNLAKKLKISTQRVSNSIVKLKKNEVLAKTSKPRTYMLNPYFCSQGSIKAMFAKRKMWDNMQQETK